MNIRYIDLWLNNGEVIWVYGKPDTPITELHIDYKHGTHTTKKNIYGKDVNGKKILLHKLRDTMIYKISVTYPDGKVEPHLIIHHDYKRTTYIEKQAMGDGIKALHKEKQEQRPLKKLRQVHATESNTPYEMAKLLHNIKYNPNNKMLPRMVKNSPYVYGWDIPVTSTVKHIISKIYGIPKTLYSVCALDGEWDVYTGEASIFTIAMENKVYTYINKSFLKGVMDKDIISRIKDTYKKYKPDEAPDVNTLHIEIVEDELAIILAMFKQIHKLKPDFLTIFNITADMPKILNILKTNDIEAKDVFSDPCIPEEYRRFTYHRGPSIKVTDSGKSTPIPYFQQWHYAVCSSTFIVIDQMLTYYQVRAGGKNIVGGYGLDNLLKVNKITGKLKIQDDNTKGLIKAQWHVYMVRNRPIEYIVYNIWDTYSMLALDKKTKDLNTVIPLLVGVSEIYRVNSGPKKIVDALHYFFLERGYAIGVKGVDKIMDRLQGLSGWILIMEGHKIVANGLNISEEYSKGKLVLEEVFKEFVGISEVDNEAIKILEELNLPKHSEVPKSNIRVGCKDSDITSSYPSVTETCNLSNDTIVCEVANISGIDRTTSMRQNMNLFLGGNHVEWCTTMLGYPTLMELYTGYKKDTLFKKK